MSWVRTRIAPSSRPRAAGFEAKPRKAAMKSDSFIVLPGTGRGTIAAGDSGGAAPDCVPAPPPRVARFPSPYQEGLESTPHVFREGVEQAVDEAGLALVVKGLGDVDIFGDHAARR